MQSEVVEMKPVSLECKLDEPLMKKSQEIRLDANTLENDPSFANNEE